MLQDVGQYLFSDVSAQPSRPMLKGQAVQGMQLEPRNITLSVTEGTGTLQTHSIT